MVQSAVFPECLSVIFCSRYNFNSPPKVVTKLQVWSNFEFHSAYNSTGPILVWRRQKMPYRRRNLNQHRICLYSTWCRVNTTCCFILCRCSFSLIRKKKYYGFSTYIQFCFRCWTWGNCISFFFYYFIYFVINGVHLSVVIYEHIRLTLFHEEVTNKEPKRNNTHASFHTFSYIFGSDIKIYIYIFFSFAEGDFFSIFGLWSK